MSYTIEYAQDRGLPFYAEFRFVDVVTKKPVQIGASEHQFKVGRWPHDWWTDHCTVVASNANGMIKTFDPGVITVSIPADQLRCCGIWDGEPRERRSAPFRLVVNPSDPVFARLIAQGTISFGGH